MKVRVLGSALTIANIALTLCCVSCSDEERASSHSNPPILIEPKLAVGQVRAGMRIDEIITQLGQPERRTANSLEYMHLGFAVMPDQDGIVQIVMCGDVTGLNGPLVKRFTGRTKEGIGLNSTRPEIIKAYGEPTANEKMRGGSESLRYDALGITFTLEAGKVYHMIVRLPRPPTLDR